ncbi:MAG TPA: enoyl-ACP reductase [Tepidisphaeraceae bacterium]|jgi:enoyl-[acyl-carrier protein] reductase I|nr:enoyl-ACP reductase [Tepidisphaeraceae bacterium]
MGLLDGKTGLILNIANDRSIAAYIGHHAVKDGATVGVGFLPMGGSIEKSERRARKAMQEHGYPEAWLAPCDVGSDESIEAFFAGAREKFGKIDFLVHSLAFADYNYLKTVEGVFTSTPRDVFKQALDISAYSLIALTRAAAPLMPDGGSIIAMTYLGSEKVVPGYNIMGVAKAALESTSRYLAYDLGNKKIRVNTISAGPIKTLAASVVGNLDEMLAHTARKAPLKRNIDADEVGKTAVYLLSDLSSGVTGENIYVDAGFNTVGL